MRWRWNKWTWVVNAEDPRLNSVGPPHEEMQLVPAPDYSNRDSNKTDLATLMEDMKDLFPDFDMDSFDLGLGPDDHQLTTYELLGLQCCERKETEDEGQASSSEEVAVAGSSKQLVAMEAAAQEPEPAPPAPQKKNMKKKKTPAKPIKVIDLVSDSEDDEVAAEAGPLTITLSSDEEEESHEDDKQVESKKDDKQVESREDDEEVESNENDEEEAQDSDTGTDEPQGAELLKICMKWLSSLEEVPLTDEQEKAIDAEVEKALKTGDFSAWWDDGKLSEPKEQSGTSMELEPFKEDRAKDGTSSGSGGATMELEPYNEERAKAGTYSGSGGASMELVLYNEERAKTGTPSASGGASMEVEPFNEERAEAGSPSGSEVSSLEEANDMEVEPENVLPIQFMGPGMYEVYQQPPRAPASAPILAPTEIRFFRASPAPQPVQAQPQVVWTPYQLPNFAPHPHQGPRMQQALPQVVWGRFDQPPNFAPHPYQVPRVQPPQVTCCHHFNQPQPQCFASQPHYGPRVFHGVNPEVAWNSFNQPPNIAPQPVYRPKVFNGVNPRVAWNRSFNQPPNVAPQPVYRREVFNSVNPADLRVRVERKDDLLGQCLLRSGMPEAEVVPASIEFHFAPPPAPSF